MPARRYRGGVGAEQSVFQGRTVWVPGAAGRSELDGERGCAGRGGRRSTLVGKVALGGRDRRHDEHRIIEDGRRSGGHSRWCRDRGDSVRLLLQDDPVSVVVRGDKFDDVIFRYPVTV